MFVPNTKYDILTPDGFRNFRGLHFIERETVRIFSGGVCALEGSAHHRVLTSTGYVTLDNIEVGASIIGKTGSHLIEHKELGRAQLLFDPIDVDHPEQSFYTNDTVSHNCSFQGSANTLIPGHKLASMTFMTPVDTRGDLKIYAQPIRADEKGNPSHIYVAMVDVSQGQEQDYSVINIFDVSISPFRQVAVYRRNNITPQLFAPIVRDIAAYYCNAYTLIEINDVGILVADTLHAELEYEHILFVRMHPKRGQMLAGGFHVKSRMGLRQTQATKRIGCAALRAMVEKDQLLIYDYETLRELTTFVAHGHNYRAEQGAHDDCVMTLVLLGWLTAQRGFEDYVGLSMRKLLINQYEPVTLDEPFVGYLSDEPTVSWTEDGDRWTLSDEDIAKDFWG